MSTNDVRVPLAHCPAQVPVPGITSRFQRRHRYLKREACQRQNCYLHQEHR